jgi:Ca2+-binding RTX toxin-like protein
MAGVPGYAADASRAAIAGHSLGAFTAALLAGAQSFKPGLDAVDPGNEFGLSEIADPRFAEAILLSPQGALGAGTTFGFTEDSWDNVTIPVLTVTGTEDNGVDGANYRDRLDGFENGPSGGKHAFVLAGANHGQLGGGDVSDPAINAEVARLMADFLDAYVKDDAAALAMLADVNAYAEAHPLPLEAYEKALAGAAGSGVVGGDDNANTLAGLSTNDAITGMGGNDTLTGGGGYDTIDGGTGDDRLAGGGGADRLTGGLGRDRLTGNGGIDRFDFNATPESGTTGAARDVITDFAAGTAATAIDRIDVSTIDANAGLGGNQAFIYGGPFTAGHIRAVQSGGNVILQFNTDADAAPEMTILLQNVLAGNLDGGDFVL